MDTRSRRRRAQAGTTLVELLVATVLMGLALAILIGLFSTGAVDSLLASRDGAAQAATEYEIDKITAAKFDRGALGYSECFAADGSVRPGGCAGSSAIQADVTVTPVGTGTSLQKWTIILTSVPARAPIGKPVSTYKANR